jgi:hypothetical protein
METIKELDEQIEILKKKKEIALLKQEVETIEKTVIEKTIIKRVTEYVPEYPAYPTCPSVTFGGGMTNF